MWSRLFARRSLAVVAASTVGLTALVNPFRRISDEETLPAIPYVWPDSTGFHSKFIRAKADDVALVLPLQKSDEDVNDNLHVQKKQFLRFASVEFRGEAFMTPRDFIESLSGGFGKSDLFRRVLTENEVLTMAKSTPRKWKNSQHFFRDLKNDGLLSFSEYMFLLTILLRPHSGFKIAFKMLDKDGNEELDLSEFLVMEQILGGSTSEDNCTKDMKPSLINEMPFSTILVHFFGPKGQDKLRLREFSRFIENFQTETMEIEFENYSRGQKNMSEVDFASVILLFSKLPVNHHKELLDRVKNHFHSNCPVSHGIPFEEYKKFFLFLNNMLDFVIAMKFFTLADKSISKREFQLAVNAVVGYKLADNIVDVLFLVFDINQDGALSHREFVKFLRKRTLRNVRATNPQKLSKLKEFKHCMRLKMMEE